MMTRQVPAHSPRPTFSFLKKRGATTWTRMQVNETPNGKMSEADAKARDRMSSGVGKMQRRRNPQTTWRPPGCQTPCAAPRRASPRTPCRRASSARSQTRTRTPRGWCRAGRRARSRTRRRRPPTPTRSAQTWWVAVGNVTLPVDAASRKKLRSPKTFQSNFLFIPIRLTD